MVTVLVEVLIMYTHTYNELMSLKPVPRLFYIRLLHVSLLHKEVAPVGQIEPSVDGGKR